jgi:hypothetical protein
MLGNGGAVTDFLERFVYGVGRGMATRVAIAAVILALFFGVKNLVAKFRR